MADDSHPIYSPDHFPSPPEDDPVEIAKKLGKTNMLQWMEITVSEPEKRSTTAMKMQDTFVVYLVETRIRDTNVKCKGDGTTSLWRRYSEFELLRNYLEIMYPAVVVPPLPEKKVSHAWQNLATDKFDADFIERRRAALEIFLLRCAAHSTLCQDKIFIGFLQKDEGWKDSVYATEFHNKAESKIKSLSASYRLRRPDRKYEELKNYSNELQSNIGNLLKIRARMADKLYGIHKVHGNYCRVFNEWSGIEKQMSEPLQSAGHYMNVYAQSIDTSLEEEEQYADQLKEYYAFGDSLRSVCRKYECLQFDQEKAEDSLSSKSSQKEMLAQGKQQGGFSLSGMKKALFGEDTQEQRELKIKHLDEQIKITQAELKQINEDYQKFLEASIRDLDRFKRQKTKDLKEIFTNYAIMQIKQCKKILQIQQSDWEKRYQEKRVATVQKSTDPKGIAIWTSAKDCFTKM